MKRVSENGDWTLFSPNETPDLHDLTGAEFEKRYCEYEEMARQGQIKTCKTMKAADLWRKMLSMLYETGHPWVTFKDCVRRNSTSAWCIPPTCARRSP